MEPELSVTVLICTFRRPAELLRCLKALEAQERAADEVMVVVQERDTATSAELSNYKTRLPLRIVWVQVPGLVAARNAALAALENEVVAMIDDDTVPYPDWLRRVEQHFLSNASVGGVGGRDRCVNDPSCDTTRRSPVGLVRYWGQRIGNNHCGYGAARETDTLKGANMSYRRSAIGDSLFDSRLRGSGSTPGEDLAFSLRIRAKGWKLVYDPAVLVDHYEGFREEPRHYSGMTAISDPVAFGTVTYNWTVSIWDHFSPLQRGLYFLWQSLIGNRVSPGLVQAIRFTPKMRGLAWARFWYTQQALVAAFRELPRLPNGDAQAARR